MKRHFNSFGNPKLKLYVPKVDVYKECVNKINKIDDINKKLKKSILVTFITPMPGGEETKTPTLLLVIDVNGFYKRYGVNFENGARILVGEKKRMDVLRYDENTLPMVVSEALLELLDGAILQGVIKDCIDKDSNITCSIEEFNDRIDVAVKAIREAVRSEKELAKITIARYVTSPNSPKLKV